MDIEKEDVKKLLEDPEFGEAVVSAVLADRDVVQDLAEGVADCWAGGYFRAFETPRSGFFGVEPWEVVKSSTVTQSDHRRSANR